MMHVTPPALARSLSSFPKNCIICAQHPCHDRPLPGEPLEFIPTFCLGHEPVLPRLRPRRIAPTLNPGLKSLRMKFGRSNISREPRLAFVTQTPLEQLLPRAHPGFYPANTVVCEGNQFSEAAYLILSGGCEVRLIQRDGKPQVCHRLSPGETFGAEENRPEDARTVAVATADSVILRIDRKHFDELRSHRHGGTPRLNGNGHPSNGQGASLERILPLRTVPERPSHQVV